MMDGQLHENGPLRVSERSSDPMFKLKTLLIVDFLISRPFTFTDYSFPRPLGPFSLM